MEENQNNNQEQSPFDMNQPLDQGNAEFQQPYEAYVDEPVKESNGFGIASLVLGIVSLLCCCFLGLGAIFGIVGVILGIVGIKKNKNKKGLAIAGLIVSGVGTVFGIYMFVALAIQANFSQLFNFPTDWNDASVQEWLTRSFPGVDFSNVHFNVN